MDTTSTSEQWSIFKNLNGFVRLILLVDWDPLGILGAPGAIGQYDQYAKELTTMLEENASKDELVERLKYLQRTRLGSGKTIQQISDIVDKLIEVSARFEMNTCD